MNRNLFVILTLGFILSNSFFFESSFAQSDFSVESLYEPGIEAVTSFATTTAETLPKIIAAVILLIIGLIAGKIVGSIIEKTSRKILEKSHLQNHNDDLVSQTSPNKDSSKLISASVRWFIYLFFIIAAINALEFTQLSSALTDLWLWVPNLLAFILIIVIGLIVASVIGKWLDQELVKSEFGGSKYIKSGVKVIIYAVIFAIALTQLGIGQQIIPILISAFSWSIAIGIGAAIAIGLGFTLKEVLPSAISSMSKQKTVLAVGQKVRIGEHEGVITASELLHIILVNDKNESVVIPTKDLSSKSIIVLGKE